MYEYLSDIEFLKALDKVRFRTQYAKLELLSFDEELIKTIEGNVTAGTLNINGSSAIRRTINLTMLASPANSNIEDINNEIAINKKVRVFIGYENPLKQYESYGTVVWFPCGMFILSTASITMNTSGWTIQITGKDKMCLLDGTVGGMLPATVVFHEKYIEDADGNQTKLYPTIREIIYEAVNHWGEEKSENIVINDIEDEVQQVVKYIGDKVLRFSENYSACKFAASDGQDDNWPHAYSTDEDVGYRITDFTYPSELTLKAGDTVVTLLNKIVETLGNFEFFYDVYGVFHFQEIKNYLNKASPLDELDVQDYVKSYSNTKFLYSLTDLDTIISVTRAPKYDNIKNDFHVWGEQESAAGTKREIHYHLAIDAKPSLNLAKQWMWKHIKSDNTIEYIFNYSSKSPGSSYILDGAPCDEWREELYRQALNAQQTTSVYSNIYDAELIANWRTMYYLTSNKSGMTYSTAVTNKPDQLLFWLDFIDIGSEMGKYSVNQIGRRSKVVTDQKVKTIKNNEVPDVLFVSTTEMQKDSDLVKKYKQYGKRVFQLTDKYFEDYFDNSSTSASCFDRIRELLYQNLNYNTTITISCLPRYYMDANNIIYIYNKENNIDGNYQITQMSLPLTYNGTMSITATEVLVRI